VVRIGAEAGIPPRGRGVIPMRRHLPLALLILLCAALVSPLEPAGSWTPLFDGRTLDGWTASENPASFRVEDGAILCDGPRAHLFYTGAASRPGLENFELDAEVMTRPGANSGIYFHTAWQEQGWPAAGFEVQINNTQPRHGDYLELKKTGSLYGIRNVYKALVSDDEWFTVRVTVQKPRVQIRLNERLVADYEEPEAAPAGLDPPVPRLGRGTIALQCHDPSSKVFFRRLRVRTLGQGTRTPGTGALPDLHAAQRLRLSRDNFPLMDLHVHLKGDLTIEEALRQSRATGIGLGVAVNCGKGFPIQDDAGIEAFLRDMRGQPVFVGMQAEGREWVHMFSPEARARFDYVFTDAMTFTDHRGQRTRLWIKEEVEIDDEQAFMDRLVATTVGILEREPIDVYVNPTFLPDVIAARYDTLWTPERMARVIEAAAGQRIAIEINNRYRIPSQRFLRQAKQAGVKFTCGTNNVGPNLGDFSYCLEMQQALGLTWQDMFLPGLQPKRALRQKTEN
jgi:Domain of Unknown Function (DUF1080)